MSMATTTTTPSETGGYKRIAHPVHTIIVLLALGLWAYLGKIRADQMRDAADVDRVYLYARTMLLEWLMFGLVLLGVWRNGSPLATVVGERWRSFREVARDLGIGVVFVVVAILISSIVGGHGQAEESNRAVQYLLPSSGAEKMIWIALSITAGICEEAVNRGYLQRQFTALTNSVPAGIILQAIVFGAAHAYQGLRRTIPIGVLGLMLGGLAQWRKSVRPGMLTHAVQDTLAIFVRH
jgi:membrane protease YdiL (CAAX protease family)